MNNTEAYLYSLIKNVESNNQKDTTNLVNSLEKLTKDVDVLSQKKCMESINNTVKGTDAPYCRKCVREMFDNYERKYGTNYACIFLCYKLDVPYYYSLYDSIIKNNNKFSIGLYLRQLNNRQYQYQDFSQSILNEEVGKRKEDYESVAIFSSLLAISLFTSEIATVSFTSVGSDTVTSSFSTSYVNNL